MRVFISWSGDLSRRIALVLRGWLPVALPFVDPWVSSEDIPKGARWASDLADQLERTDSGILCLVPDNLAEAWLLFEAGALSKSVQKGRVHPLLFGMEPSQLPGPLAQFQATRCSKEELRKLMHALDSEAEKSAMGSTRVDQAFDVCWPDLESRLPPLLREATVEARAKSDSSKLADPESALPKEEVALLRAIAETDELRADEAGRLLNVHPQRAQHLMENLEKAGLLVKSLNYLHGPAWHLNRAGRAYLVRAGLL